MPRVKLKLNDYSEYGEKAIHLGLLPRGRFRTWVWTLDRHAEVDMVFFRFVEREWNSMEKLIAAHAGEYQALLNMVAGFKPKRGQSIAESQFDEGTKAMFAEQNTWHILLKTLAAKPAIAFEKLDSWGMRLAGIYSCAPNFTLAALSMLRAAFENGITEKDRLYLALSRRKTVSVCGKQISLANATDGEIAIALGHELGRDVKTENVKKARQLKAKIDVEHLKGTAASRQIPFKE